MIKTLRARWIKADGTAIDVVPSEKYFSLKELQHFVGGYVEVLHLSDGREMYVNEDGYAERLLINYNASELYGGNGVRIFGDVLVCDKGLVK